MNSQEILVCVKDYISEGEYYYLIKNDEIINLSVDEDGSWYEDSTGDFKGFFDDNINGYIVDCSSNCEYFHIVDDFKILEIDYDFFGTGYDRVKMSLKYDSFSEYETEYFKSSRWNNQVGVYKRI